MNWQVLTILSVFLVSLSTLLQKVLLKNDKSNPIAFAIAFQLFTGFFLILFSLFFGGIQLQNISSVAFNIVIMTMLYGICNIFIFKAIKHIDLSKFSILFTTRGIFTIIASTILLKEGLNTFQLLGAILIMSGVFFVSLKKKKIVFVKEDAFAFLAAFCFGVALTNDRFILKSLDLNTYLSIAFLLPGIFIAIFNVKALKEIKFFLNKQKLSILVILSFTYALAAIAFFKAIQISSNVSQVSTISLSAVVFTVLLSIVLLKEYENLKMKLVGAILCFIGLILVS